MMACWHGWLHLTAVGCGVQVFHIFIFGLFAFVLYAGIRDGECHVDAQPTYQYCSVFSKDCTDYFSRIVDSMLHLFTLITTANYPDVRPCVLC